MTRGASAHHRSDGSEGGVVATPSRDLVDEQIVVCYYVAA